MAEEIQIISTFDNEQTLKALSEEQKAVNDNAKALERSAARAEKVFKRVIRGRNQQIGIIEEIRISLKELEKARDKANDVKSIERFNKKIAEATFELKQLSKAGTEDFGQVIKNVEDLSTKSDKLGTALTGVGLGAAGFEIAERGAALFGIENENLEETLNKVKTAMKGLEAAEEIKHVLEKESALRLQVTNGLEKAKALTLGKTAAAQKIAGAAQKAYTFAVGSSSGALKIFRLALIATGIGAIIVAIGLLIANFDAIKEAVEGGSESFDNFKKVLLFLMPPLFILIKTIEFTKKALQDLGIIQSEEEKRAVEASENKIKALEEEQTAVEDRFNFEIAKAGAAGENTFKLEKQKKKVVIESLKAQAQAIVVLVKLTGEFTEQQEEQLEEISKLAKKLSQERVVNEIRNTKKIADDSAKAAKKAAKEAERLRKEQEKADKEHAERLLAIANELVDLQIASITNEAERELAVLDKKFDARIERLRQGGEKEIELAIALEKEKERQIEEVGKAATLRKEEREKEETDKRVQQNLEAFDLETQFLIAKAIERQAAQDELAIIKRESDLERLEIEREENIISEEEFNVRRLEIENAFQESVTQKAQEEAEKRKAVREEAFSQGSNLLGSLSSLNSSLSDAAVNEAEGNEAKQQAIRKKSFERNKKIQIGLAVISGVQGVINALTAQSVIPEPFGTILKAANAVAIGVATAANIKKIKSTKLSGGGGGGSASVPSSSGGAGSISGASPLIPSGGLGEGSGADSETDTQAAGSNQIIKAFVVESEISSEQSNAKVIEEKSELT